MSNQSEFGEFEAAQTALKIVDRVGKNYIITQTKQQRGQSPELTIIAKDGRGEILKFNNRGLTSNLQDKDINKFAQMQQKITEYQSKQQNKSKAQEANLVR